LRSHETKIWELPAAFSSIFSDLSDEIVRRLLVVFSGLLPIILIACGDGPSAPTNITPTGRRLSVGELTACALDSVGKVYCWGTNSPRWEYGTSPTNVPASQSPVLVPIPNLAGFAAGVGQHMCGLTASRHALCWGRGQSGQIGAGSLGPLGNPPTEVQSIGQSWADISVGRLSTCGLTPNGDGFCWGTNQRGEIGNSSISVGVAMGTPTPMTANSIVFKSIVTGWTHACGIATTGAAYCWGDNSQGQLGIGFADTDLHLEPLIVSFSDRFEQLALSARSTCGITLDHRALCWGYNGFGQLGDGTTIRRPQPTPVAGAVKFKAIALASGFAGGTDVALPVTNIQGSWAHACAIAETGEPYCWGWNAAGQVGDGSTDDKLAPTLVSGGLQLTSIALGGSASCGMRGSAIWCWGSNTVGQLGNGTTVNSAVPVQVGGPFNKP
jgi:alpha-tubulin suppressor-like RCC1 family protein